MAYKDWTRRSMKLNSEFNFGKYKGFTLCDVILKDVTYIRYAINFFLIEISEEASFVYKKHKNKCDIRRYNYLIYLAKKDISEKISKPTLENKV